METKPSCNPCNNLCQQGRDCPARQPVALSAVAAQFVTWLRGSAARLQGSSLHGVQAQKTKTPDRRQRSVTPWTGPERRVNRSGPGLFGH